MLLLSEHYIERNKKQMLKLNSITVTYSKSKIKVMTFEHRMVNKYYKNIATLQLTDHSAIIYLPIN